jgi:hypothetical protein
MIWIFGDSFATNQTDKSWAANIGKTANFASNGSSEYRILKTYLHHLPDIKHSDTVIFVHTSPTRIFLKHDKTISSRLLQSHTQCDIIINDVYEKKEKEYIKILETIWDDEYFNDMFDLIVDKLQIPNSLHLTFFETTRSDIVSLNHIWCANQGKINHMDEDGNRLTAQIVNQLIR